jgi:hypothetical protein
MLDIPAIWRGQAVPDDAVQYYEEMWLREEPELRRFQAFWERQAVGEPPIVISFPGGMLHFVFECVAHLPRERPVFAVGSGLSREEEGWAAAHLGVPFHSIGIDCDDKTVWEFLFATAGRGFMWLDADCFVLDASLLDDMLDPLGDHELRGVFGRPGEGQPLIQTSMLAIGPGVIEAMGSRVPTAPSTYCHDVTRLGRHRMDVFSRVYLPAHREALARYVAVDADGAVQGDMPGVIDVYADGACYPSFLRQAIREAIADGTVERRASFLDTTVMMQVMALEAGGTVSILTDLETYLISDRLIHNGRLGYHRWSYMDRTVKPAERPPYGRPDLLPKPDIPNMVVDLPLLSRFVRRFPMPSYCELERSLTDRWQRFSSRIPEFGMDPADMERSLVRRMADAGLDREALVLLRDD